MTEAINYESEGFFKDFVYFSKIGEVEDELKEAYVRISDEDEERADIIYNDVWYVGKWLEDEERFIVIL